MHPIAAQSLLVRRRDPLGVFVLASVAGHAALVGVGLLAGHLFGPKVIDLDQKPIRASLVRKGKPRDERLLPRKEELPPPPAAEKAVAVPIPGAKPEPVKEPPPKNAQKDGDERRKQLFGAFDKTAKAHNYEELAGQEDGDPDGDSAVQEGERYFGLVKAQVRRHYDVSNTIPEQERLRLRAEVRVTISRTGEVSDAMLHKPSGNTLFDAAVVSAAKKASPLSPPPDHLRERLGSDGVILQFTP